MDRVTKVVFVLVLTVLALLLIIGGCSVYFAYRVVDATAGAMSFLEQCPLPEELSLENNSQPTQEETKAMLAWCCLNYDGSHKVCKTLES